MTDPITIATLGISAASGIVGAAGAAQKDDAQAAMSQYKAGVAAANAKIARDNAAYTMQVGDIKALNRGLQGQQELGQAEVARAASGIQVGTGTGALVRRSQLEQIQTDEGTIRADAAKQAYGYEVQAMNFTSEGQLDTSAAQFAEQQKGFDVAGSLLGGASSVADKWVKYSQAGVPGSGGSGGGFSLPGIWPGTPT